MKIIQKVIRLKGDEYHAKHLEIINPFLPIQLTSTEIKVLSAFMSFTGELAEKERFGTSFRKEVKINLKLSDGGMSNHLRHLTEKGAIYLNDEGVLTVRDFLFPEEGEQSYQFKIIKDENISS